MAEQRRRRWSLRLRLRALGAHHGRAALASLGRLWRGKLTSLMSTGVAGIALALPLGLAVVVHNAAALAGVSTASARISVFLDTGLDSAAIAAARNRAAALPGVVAVDLVTPAEALRQFDRLAGFRAAVASLGSNPLPPVLVVTPAATDAASVTRLATALGAIQGADRVVADTRWLARLDAMLGIARRATWVLAGLLGLAVLLVIGNTIRLEIQSRRTEIEVEKLVGATNAFVRRPFLYGGLWYGAAGGLLAWCLVEIALAFLAAPVARLSQLYAGDARLAGPGFPGLLAMIAGGALLGWLGAGLAVGRHLRAIEPS